MKLYESKIIFCSVSLTIIFNVNRQIHCQIIIKYDIKMKNWKTVFRQYFFQTILELKKNIIRGS